MLEYTYATDVEVEGRKRIGPAGHAVLDYTTAAAFLAMAARYRGRNERAARLALINGLSVLGLSLMTDYPGGVFRWISFKTHGIIDAVQAAMAGAGPALFGFSGDRDARPFYAQAAVEAAVIGATDWNALEGRYV
jgi:hypothetical protein